MSVRIQFDKPHAFYTNLDFISGRIILSLTSDDAVSAIVAKLEGESRTQLRRPIRPPDNRQPVVIENHKILYKISQVFPEPHPANGQNMGSAFTLRAGKHEYPFRFKIPFNNGCGDPQQQQMAGFGGLGLSGFQQMQYRHVRKTLPPSLTGFPGEAEIRYYVKVTVQRPGIFKENRRSAVGFRFLPIEPPRPPPTTNEVYARRPFGFQTGLASYGKKSSMFRKSPKPLSDTAPTGEIDARLPSPAILTCNEPIPLRLIVKKTNQSAENVFLVSLQVHLHGYTEVRALDVSRTETSTWSLMSANGLSIPIGSPSDPPLKEITVDNNLWDRIPLPNTVAPSFQTCNLARKYELEIRAGLGYGVIGEIQPQIITLPLRFQVEVHSGISPPAALLDAMAQQRPPVPARPTAQTPTPVSAPAADPLYPPQLGTPAAAVVDDAPPSYEDAMAEDITPTDGPRREYSGVTDVNAPGMDEKGGGKPPSGGGNGAAGGGGFGAVV
ncbi:Uncharacterized protein BP5553_03295 [Venustampulla echinocandica]|uniref:Arrestin-like N-terminal domain-containing protein n=1 Tax=Venustampulla echinocandica TaxID=2656787 RepID=A0A370TTV5_9HELO|nr:Uncharacterized protein BP5553_03295 [Venustampulla echinocandica]RDL38955.1 Uncharacterized protein BP5553_03295 [Venustampulla echinocandica]